MSTWATQEVEPRAIATMEAVRDAALNHPLRHRYLLVTGIPCHMHQGKRWIDRLWHIDLVRHLEYLSNFTLAAPRRCEPIGGDAVCLDDDARFKDVRFVDLPDPRSMLQGIAAMPRTVTRLWRATAQAHIVHTGVANWPIPMGWLAVPVARLRRRFVLMVIESASWRVTPGERASIGRRLRAFVYERLNRWCVRTGDLRLFSHETYRREFLGGAEASGRSLVLPASWVSAEQLIDEEQLLAAHRRRDAQARPCTRVLFAGRLVADKGLEVLLEAAERLSPRDRIIIDVIGAGPLEDRCRASSGPLHGRLRLLGTLGYADFLQAMRDYDAVVVPSIADEQPRIVFDAFSQGAAVLGSATSGIRFCVEDGVTGRLTTPGDVAALANLLAWAAHHRDELRQMGREGLAVARVNTHEYLHYKRCEVIRRALMEANVQP